MYLINIFDLNVLYFVLNDYFFFNLLYIQADIFFDNYDDGFLSAISTLATDSKRPLILTANDPFSNHLLKFFLSNRITLNFIRPPKEHLGKQ